MGGLVRTQHVCIYIQTDIHTYIPPLPVEQIIDQLSLVYIHTYVYTYIYIRPAAPGERVEGRLGGCATKGGHADDERQIGASEQF